MLTPYHLNGFACLQVAGSHRCSESSAVCGQFSEESFTNHQQTTSPTSLSDLTSLSERLGIRSSTPIRRRRLLSVSSICSLLFRPRRPSTRTSFVRDAKSFLSFSLRQQEAARTLTFKNASRSSSSVTSLSEKEDGIRRGIGRTLFLEVISRGSRLLGCSTILLR